ncbi:MAG: hypothetical protein ACRENU_06965 [Gemmatimonadaceae bacterium]
MRSRIVGWLGSLLVGVALSSCSDSTDPGPPCADPDGGTFVSHPPDALRGCASYAVASSGGSTNTVLLVSVGPLTSPTTLLSLVRPGARPAMGTYQIGANPGNFSGSILMNGSTFSVTSGTVTIDASLEGDLQGSVGATGVQSGSGASITVAGVFTAVCTPSGSITC